MLACATTRNFMHVFAVFLFPY